MPGAPRAGRQDHGPQRTDWLYLEPDAAVGNGRPGVHQRCRGGDPADASRQRVISLPGDSGPLRPPRAYGAAPWLTTSTGRKPRPRLKHSPANWSCRSPPGWRLRSGRAFRSLAGALSSRRHCGAGCPARVGADGRFRWETSSIRYPAIHKLMTPACVHAGVVIFPVRDPRPATCRTARGS